MLTAEHPEAPVWIVDTREQLLITTLKALTDGDKAVISYTTVLLPPQVGGLTKDGMLDGATDTSNEIQYDVADEWYEDKERTKKRRIRLRCDPSDELLKDMALEHEIRLERPEEENEDAESPQVWRWYVKRPEATNERNKTAYELQPHLDEVKWWAAQIVGRLMAAQSEMAKAVILAAWCHDLGKRRARWQRCLGNDNYPAKEYAKSGKLLDGSGALRPRDFLRNDYRHEFGSVLDLCDENHPHHAEFIGMSPEMQDLVLHLIAAHHGRARPHFPPEEAEDDFHSQAAAKLAVETPQRFARLHRRYGRWGLAYLESLVRAADYIASANPNTAGKEEQA
jgi:CRISPR-associated endonuclease/helicase Cas3